ncbi:MAG: ABC transporter permease [Chloroflexi bacterium]|nr:ABC transporter permease [Chloroflexota bacterium]
MAAGAGTISIQPKLETKRQESQFAIVLRRFIRHRLAVISCFLIVLIFGASLLAPVLAPFSPTRLDGTLGGQPRPPGIVDAKGQVHWLGVDNLGRDLYTRVLYAGRISITIAIFVTILTELVGVLIGAIAGYYGGFVDALVSRVTEFMITIPLLPILAIVAKLLIQYNNQLPIPDFIISGVGAILLTPATETPKVIALIIVLVLFGWMGTARLMRGMAFSLRGQDFIESLRAFGASDARIILRHIIPNGLAPIIVAVSLDLGGVIITEAVLSFLGVGVQDPTPTWGNMLSQAQSYMFQHPWLPLISGIPLLLVSLTFNFIGDGLRDALDPRLKR